MKHRATCEFIGTSGQYRFGFAEYHSHEVFYDVDGKEVNMHPTPRGRARVFGFDKGSAQRMCKHDRACDAYRRALELVEAFGYSMPERGYPIWWRSKSVVLAYLPRTDEFDHLDEDDPDFQPQREPFIVLTREEAIARFRDSWTKYYHLGKHVPTPENLGLSFAEATSDSQIPRGTLLVEARRAGGGRVRHARSR